MARVIINWRPDGTEEYYDGPTVGEAVLNAAMDWHLSGMDETVKGALELIEVVGYEVCHEWLEAENGGWLTKEAGWSMFKCRSCGAVRFTLSIDDKTYSDFVQVPGCDEVMVMSEGRKSAGMPPCRGSHD